MGVRQPQNRRSSPTMLPARPTPTSVESGKGHSAKETQQAGLHSCEGLT